MLTPLTQLQALGILLGGTTDLSHLPLIGRLDYLQLFRIRGLNDLSSISDMRSLRYLQLDSLRQVTALPDLRRLGLLETVWLETMKGITDLRPILGAPALRNLALVGMNQLMPSDVGVLVDHPRLQRLLVSLGSRKKELAVQELLPLATGPIPRPAVFDR